MLRLIENTKVKNPFYHETIGIHLWSMEELCYFMETHIYLIDPIWVGEGLFTWIDTELGLKRLAQTLRRAREAKEDEFCCVGMILRASGNYSREDMEVVTGLLNQMRGRTKIERRKISGDLFLADGKYRQAAYTYMELLGKKYVNQMTEELKGNICHNLGVVYARLFMFDEAASLFAEAYKLRRDLSSRDAYLCAVNFSSDDGPIDEKEMPDLNFNIMREVLGHLTEVAEDPDYYEERKKASQASDALDWKTAEAGLLAGWQREYRGFL